jgi:hypothetical protein
MTMPFERIGQFISKKIEGMAVAGEKTLDTALEKSYAHGSTVTTTAVTAPTPGAPGAPAAPLAAAAGPGGVIAAVGLTVAAVGSSLAFIVTQVKSLTLFDVITAGIIMSAGVMVPSGLLGWFKLRKRNLALLLEGSGWALNDRLNLTRDMAAIVTRRPRLPKNATVDRTDVLRSVLVKVREDDQEERGSPGRWVAIVLVALFVLLWQLREPLVRVACARHWANGAVCDSLLSPGSSPAVPPAPPAQP